jgi:bifunctional non-homologous end joining protein LigD
MREHVRREGWEGLIAKAAASRYESGRRSPQWLKLKAVKRQEFVVGGWTEPRQTRQFFGALLLGVYDDGTLRYVGHTGSGFTQAELQRVARLLRPLETEQSPFAVRPKTNEPAHWVEPRLVVEVKFTEWTNDGKLRHPIYVGLRDDKPPERVRREQPGNSGPPVAANLRPTAKRPYPTKSPRSPKSFHLPHSSPVPPVPPLLPVPPVPPVPRLPQLAAQIEALEAAGRDGVLTLPDGAQLKVTNLRKVFWPGLGITKGELMRYYTRISPCILPAVEDRPLVMKRFPNGIEAQAFYQQRAREEPQPGVRTEILANDLDPIGEPDARRFVGGSLLTLLYMTQMAAISQDPWFSRVGSPLHADYVALDLDPMEDAPFARVLDVARWTRDELDLLGAPSVPKTSGASGLHIYIPLPPKTTYESGQLFCQIIATIVAAKHPKAATIVRAVRRRGKTQVYVDYLQNILGKTLATAYSARASEFAGVSTPLTWQEVDAGVDPRDFTIRTVPARVDEVGDLWARLRTAKPVDLRAILH